MENIFQWSKVGDFMWFHLIGILLLWLREPPGFPSVAPTDVPYRVSLALFFPELGAGGRRCSLPELTLNCPNELITAPGSLDLACNNYRFPLRFDPIGCHSNSVIAQLKYCHRDLEPTCLSQPPIRVPPPPCCRHGN